MKKSDRVFRKWDVIHNFLEVGAALDRRRDYPGP